MNHFGFSFTVKPFVTIILWWKTCSLFEICKSSHGYFHFRCFKSATSSSWAVLQTWFCHGKIFRGRLWEWDVQNSNCWSFKHNAQQILDNWANQVYWFYIKPFYFYLNIGFEYYKCIEPLEIFNVSYSTLTFQVIGKLVVHQIRYVKTC